VVASIANLPEVIGLDARRGLVRIPPELDVPLTPRVRAVIDTAEFRRLAKITQLGLVSLVYPAAHHRRFEHSLGVYRLCLLYLKQLAHDPRFTAAVSPADAERLIVASLVHDIGHWPFCHLIEDMQLADIPSHEAFARKYLTHGELAEILVRAWRVAPDELADLLEGRGEDRTLRLLSSILSGPIDVDKMDYLMRDSLHAGVPYGRNFDQARLIGSLCLNEAGDGLAVTDKGRTAAEMLVFARYVMFSEVYWHHAVRSATAMFQRAFFRLHRQLDLAELFCMHEEAFVEQLARAAGSGPVGELLQGLFGSRRQLYKRWREYTYFEDPRMYRRLARRPYGWLVDGCERMAAELSARLSRPVPADHVLIDAPPTQREVQFKVDIVHAKTGRYRPLVEVSPVVKTLAETQFDDYVKRVRVFLHPQLSVDLAGIRKSDVLLEQLLDECCDASGRPHPTDDGPQTHAV
jgi:HD superfamily phosphohydrolase